MNLQEINKQYQKMQKLYGDPGLDSILNGGEFNSPDLCLIFMNPTSKNIAANKKWLGLKSENKFKECEYGRTKIYRNKQKKY